MTDKDPKDMTVSEQLRWAANGEPYNGIDENIWTYPTGKIRALAEAVTGEWPSDNEIFSIVADKIDAELAQARRSGLERAAKSWAKANGWPGFKPGEDFGAWLDRCAYKKPVDDCNEPVQFGELVSSNLFGAVKVSAIEFTEDGTHVKDAPDGDWSTSLEVTTSRLKRPAPEVLGADGKPIKVGETVWLTDEMAHWAGVCTLNSDDKCGLSGVGGRDPLKVGSVNHPRSGTVRFANAYSPWCPASWLTHTPPDTQERIDADARKTTYGYWRCDDFSCGECPSEIDGKKPYERYNCPEDCFTSMKLDLLRRQRELDARKGGA